MAGSPLIKGGAGIISYPGTLDRPEGSARLLTNVDVSQPGVWKPRPGFLALGSVSGDIQQLWPRPGTGIYAQTGATTVTASPSSWATSYTVTGTGERSYTWDRTTSLIYANSHGPMYVQPASTTNTAIGRYALPQASPPVGVTFVNDATFGFVPNTQYIWIRICYTIQMPDGSTLEGPPSVAMLYQSNVVLGRISLDVPRLNNWFLATVGATAYGVNVYITEPGASPPVNDLFYLGNDGDSATINPATAGALSLQVFNYTRNPTKPLYTNSAQEGSAMTNQPPPYAKYMVTYRGCAIYCADRAGRQRKQIGLARTNLALFDGTTYTYTCTSGNATFTITPNTTGLSAGMLVSTNGTAGLALTVASGS
jgi:hypothetical protein